MNPRTIIRSLSVLCIVLGTGLGTLRAQSDYSDRQATSMLTVGVSFSGGASMMLDPAEFWKVQPVFAFRTGVDVTYPLTPVIGATLELGIDNRGSSFYWHEDQTLFDDRHVTYFSVTPGFLFSAFYMGVNIGFPMSGGKVWQNTSLAEERTQELDADVYQLSVMIEPRIGAVVPLLDTDLGWLGLTIGAGYNISDMSDIEDFLPGHQPGVTQSQQSVSMHVGTTWQFAIPGTGRK
jgi:hypothetical protein